MVKERHLGLAGDGFCQQRLTGTGRADHQHAARDLAAQFLEFAWITQEFDHLRDLVLGLFHARHIGKGHLDLILAEHARFALAEGHGASTGSATLHLAHEKDPQADEDEQREPVDQNLHQNRRLLRWRRHDFTP